MNKEEKIDNTNQSNEVVEPKKKSNVLLIVIIILLIIGVGVGCWYLGSQSNSNKENKTNTSDDNKKEPEDNKNEGTETIPTTTTKTNRNQMSDDEIVAYEFDQYFKLLSGEDVGYGNDECSFTMGAYTESFGSDNEINLTPGVADYECIHNLNFALATGYFDSYGLKLLTEEEYKEFKKYINVDLEPLDKYGETDEFDVSKFMKKGYYVGYVVPDGGGARITTYKIESINKKGNKYDVTIEAILYDWNSETDESIPSEYYKGTTTVEVVNKYLKYDKIILKKYK